MPAQKIPRREWPSFFDSFSQRHKDWLVTIEVMNRDIGEQVEARELPLAGITTEVSAGGKEQIEIMAGNEPDAHISHTVVAPTQVWLKRDEAGADEAVEIVSQTMKLLVRFRAAVPPEMVDGIVTG